MRRRTFLCGVAAAAASLSHARAQRPELPVVGFLNSVSAAQGAQLAAWFLEGLKGAGFVEGESTTMSIAGLMAAMTGCERSPLIW